MLKPPSNPAMGFHLTDEETEAKRRETTPIPTPKATELVISQGPKPASGATVYRVECQTSA